MGIPRLRGLLGLYAEKTQLKDRDVVVDGPAFCYHILDLCQRTTRKTSPFELPSYELLGHTAREWLDHVQTHGVEIRAIYFDGFLPAYKREERMMRMRKATSLLVKYSNIFASGVPPARLKADLPGSSPAGPAVELFPSGRVAITGDIPGFSSRSLPSPPPFLVPSILEALAEDAGYAAKAEVVPGEADLFCARAVADARRPDPVVLTSDSDLMVHHLGPRGGVVAFADITTTTMHKQPGTHNDSNNNNSSNNPLSALIVRPSHVCASLQLAPDGSGLRGLAFELSVNSHLRLEQAANRAKKCVAKDANPQLYEEFTQRYCPPPLSAQAPEPRDRTRALEGGGFAGVTLDPRISEIVLQFHQSPPTHESSVNACLPCLLDSPQRTSAWAPSTSIRQLAYALLNAASDSTYSHVSEFRRLRTGSSGTPVEIPRDADIDGRAVLITDLIKQAGDRWDLTWTVLSLYLDARTSLVDLERPNSPSLDVLRSQVNGTLDPCSWDLVHLHAQAQATLYSLRMLLQALDVRGSAGATDGTSGPIEQLRTCLADNLPKLAGFPSLRDFADLLRSAGESEGRGSLARLCERHALLGDALRAALQSRQEQGRQEQKRETQKATKPVSSVVLNNIYSVLADGAGC